MVSKRILPGLLLALFLVVSACAPLDAPHTANQAVAEPASASTPTISFTQTTLPPAVTPPATEAAMQPARVATRVAHVPTTPVNYHSALNIIYAQISGIDPHLLSLDVYYRDPLSDRHPVMLYIHGGGWTGGDKAQVGIKPEFFTQAGYVFVSANYRHSPEAAFPAHVQDVAAAVAWVSKSIHQFGGDPDQIYLMGHSAGGHLVTLVASNEQYLKEIGLTLTAIKGVISLDTAAYDLSEFASRCKNRSLPEPYSIPFGQDPTEWMRASPVTYILPGKQIPPMAVIFSGDTGIGSTVPREQLAAEFAQKLSVAGVPYVLFGDKEKSHNQINDAFGQADDLIAPRAMEFFKKFRSIVK